MNKLTHIYLVGVPWDSYRIDYIRVFKTEAKARAYIQACVDNGKFSKGCLFIETVELNNIDNY